MAPLKQCRKCLEWKPHDDFHADRKRSDGRYPNCRECHRAYMRNRYANDPTVKQVRIAYETNRRNSDPHYVERNRQRGREFYASIEGRAKVLLKSAQRRDPNATVTLDHILNGIRHGACPKTGLTFDLSDEHVKRTGRSNNPCAPSLDRINPKLGYTNENTRIVVWQYNWMKGELTDDEIYFFCLLLVSKK